MGLILISILDEDTDTIVAVTGAVQSWCYTTCTSVRSALVEYPLVQETVGPVSSSSSRRANGD